MSQSLFPFVKTRDIHHHHPENRTATIIPYSSLRIGMLCKSDSWSSLVLALSLDDVLPLEADGRAFVTRMILQREDLYRALGPGACNIAEMSERTGCGLLTSDLHGSRDDNILIFSGGFHQVTDAFDQVLDVPFFQLRMLDQI